MRRKPRDDTPGYVQLKLLPAESGNDANSKRGRSPVRSLQRADSGI